MVPGDPKLTKGGTQREGVTTPVEFRAPVCVTVQVS